MTAERPDDLTTQLVDIALDAGKEILRHYGDEIEVDRKGDDSPVTVADRAAEKIILDRLRAFFPETPVIAEEEVSAGRIPEVDSRFFLVDPLDGTKEFISRNGEFTVNIALIENGVPTLGVVHAPALGTVYTGSPSGAFEGTLSEPGDHLIGWRRIEARAAGMSPVAVASRSHRDTATEDFLKARGISETRSAGSSVKFCLVAKGEADVYPRFGRTMEWDTAAGDAVLRAAGGSVESVDGGVLRYGKAERGYDNPGFIAWGKRPD
ncbi:3'(2'),5'-bisphosphate nucleotidase CysQ [Lutibaculum baratangense]|uniref:3'(2'),5'-bisphosphate nucleotidase CysQ n=1 Tax=Lutibaculum baratangense AMV1 TaxID=631454 RepID=V4T7S9_9HYPH|nr:3'(2'),5'-bisphosphate nucleotidase CysQ [Lutibaculum baratangense]ESR22663.1 3'(2'),5'-bisphosphate nucleotidase [Lutibaculum baratangense AMV1]